MHDSDDSGGSESDAGSDDDESDMSEDDSGHAAAAGDHNDLLPDGTHIGDESADDDECDDVSEEDAGNRAKQHAPRPTKKVCMGWHIREPKQQVCCSRCCSLHAAVMNGLRLLDVLILHSSAKSATGMLWQAVQSFS